MTQPVSTFKRLKFKNYPNPKRQTHSEKLSSDTINLPCSCNREVHSHTQQRRTYLRLKAKKEELQYVIPNVRSLIATHSTSMNQHWAQKQLQNNLKPKAIRRTAHLIESERQTTDFIPSYSKPRTRLEFYSIPVTMKRTHLRFRVSLKALQYVIPNLRSSSATHSTTKNQHWAQKQPETQKSKAIRRRLSHMIESNSVTISLVGTT